MGCLLHIVLHPIFTFYYIVDLSSYLKKYFKNLAFLLLGNMLAIERLEDTD